jgi:hypothetical protein
MKDRYLYTYVPVDNTVSRDGLLSTALAKDGYKKYLERSGKKNKREVLEWLDTLDPEFKRSNAVTVLSEPIPDNAHPDMLEFAKDKKLYRLPALRVLKDKGIVTDIRSINVGGTGTHPVKDVSYRRIDWKNKKPGRFLFSNVPHYLLATADGKIPPELLEEYTDEMRARDMMKDISDIADRYGKNVFAVTDGASLTRNNGSDPVRRARLAHIAYEKSIGSDPDEDWMNR